MTLPWWTQLWLNEGFATYFADMGAAYLYNEYNSNSSWPEDTGGLQPHPGPLNYMHAFSIDVLDVALRCVQTITDPPLQCHCSHCRLQMR